MAAVSRDRWATPAGLVRAVSERMGSEPWIDLAASAENAKAKRFITEQDDLFSRMPRAEANWMLAQGGKWAWCNPPYSRGNAKRFAKWCSEFAEVAPVAMLVLASQSDGWWRDYIAPKQRLILVPDRRVQFVPPDGVPKSSNNTQNLIVVMGPGDGPCITERIKW